MTRIYFSGGNSGGKSTPEKMIDEIGGGVDINIMPSYYYGAENGFPKKRMREIMERTAQDASANEEDRTEN